MFKFLLKRLAYTVLMLWGITIISFSVMHMAPGEPTDLATQMNPKATAEYKERMRKAFNLDKPLHVQYLLWVKGLATFDLGQSFSQDQRPVWDKIKERLPVTAGINGLVMIIIFSLAVPIGIISALKHGKVFDKVMTVLVFIGFATPTFWFALLLMDFFGVRLGILPISGLHSPGYESLGFWMRQLDLLRHLAIPLFVSAFAGVAGFTRYMRSAMLEVVRQDYVTTAKAKGLSPWKIYMKHAFRNALLPIITLLGLSIPGLISGSVIFETIFAIPGIGQLGFSAVMMRDYPVAMALLTMSAFLTLLGNQIAEICYAIADPRIKN